MLTALAFAHFLSELLLKEQMIIPVKKTLNSAGHINAKLIDFNEICQKNPAKSAVLYWLFLGEVFPKNFPWNRSIFLRICPENPSKFDFFPLKSREIGRFFFEFWLFSRENPAKSADFSANLPLKIPRNIRSPVIISNMPKVGRRGLWKKWLLALFPFLFPFSFFPPHQLFACLFLSRLPHCLRAWNRLVDGLCCGSALSLVLDYICL